MDSLYEQNSEFAPPLCTLNRILAFPRFRHKLLQEATHLKSSKVHANGQDLERFPPTNFGVRTNLGEADLSCWYVEVAKI
jgi:hypothetical protein